MDALTTREAVELMVNDHREVLAAAAAATDAVACFIDALVARMRDDGRLLYVGAGTSGRLGVLDASECPPTFQSDPQQVIGIIAGGDTALRQSSESREDDPDGAHEQLEAVGLTSRDTLVGIAAGGTTPYTLGAIDFARQRGALTALIACSAPPASLRVDHLLLLDTGPELLTGSTRLKAGSATKLVLNTISTVAFTQLGKVYGNLMVDLRATNDKLLDRALRIMSIVCPDITRSEAAARLERAGGRLKVAIVMQRLGVDAVGAEKLLAESDGRLGALIDGDEIAR